MRALMPLRLVLALGVSLALALLLVLLLYFTDLAFAVWDRLRQAPLAFVLGYVAVIATLAGAGAYVVWRLLRPGRSRPLAPAAAPVEPPDEAQIVEQLGRSEAAGIAVPEVRRELEELERRRAAGEVVVALFGEVSMGKSSLIQALVPGARPEVGPGAGTTRRVMYHRWESPAGDTLLLADLPGLNEVGGSLDREAREEALRAHVVVYVCDGDLTRDQFRAAQALGELDKPLVVALNKMDRYSEAELEQVRNRLQGRLGADVEVVAISGGGHEEVVRIQSDGREELLVRERPPRVEALAGALQRRIDADPGALDSLRDAAVFVLSQRKLAAASAEHRRRRARELVEGYSRKAVLGALAAVGPGTDLLIQGYLGTGMLRELCALYEVSPREVEMERFLELATRHARGRLNLLLALAGNVFKAFPGAGTVVGGVLHAVAYGLIFQSLGTAAARALESRGELAAGPALRLFEDELSEDLEARARGLASLVVARQQGRTGEPD